MIPAGSSVMACVSGGADSMVLVSLLLEFKEQLGLGHLYVFHFNHGLRGAESDGDEALVRDFCRDKGLELFVEQGHMSQMEPPKGKSTEEWARDLRYKHFAYYADKYGALAATAHNLNDRVETQLFQLARGSGLAGARSIPPVRGNIIRPLIETSRSEIEQYCREKGIVYGVDSTNSCLDYTRNYIRHQILPLFENVNSKALYNFAAFAERAGRADDFISEKAVALLEEALYRDNSLGENLPENTELSRKKYSVKVLLGAHSVVLETAVRLAIKDYCDPDEAKLSLCIKTLEEGGAVQLSGDSFFSVKGDSAVIGHRAAVHQNYRLEAQEGLNTLPGGCSFELCPREALYIQNCININKKNTLNNLIDCDKIKGNIFFRSRQEGDSFKSARGYTKSLKKLFNELKLPAEIRQGYPILADEEGIVWILGVGADRRVRVSEETVRAIEICTK